MPLKGFEVGQQRSLQRLGPPPRPRCVRLQSEGLQPPALAQRFVEREQLELRGTVLRGEQARVCHAHQLRLAGGEGDVVARERVPAVLHHEAPVAEPEGHLAAGEPFLAVDPPVLEAGVAEDIQPPDEPGREERALQILRVVAQELQ